MHRWPWLPLALALLLPLPVLSQDPAIPDPDWKVARAQFTTGINDREPVDEVILTGPPVMEIYFFTDLRHFEGRTVSHRWEYEGQLISVKPFTVEGPRWRVFSKKEILPEQVGEWSVTVVDESGWPVHTELFRYEAGAEEPVADSGEHEATMAVPATPADSLPEESRSDESVPGASPPPDADQVPPEVTQPPVEVSE